MADQVDPNSTPAPNAQPAQPPVVTPQPQPAPQPQAAPVQQHQAPPVGEPGWLKDRLESARATERNRLLQELGVTDVGAARNAIEASRSVPELRTQYDRAQERIKEHAARQMSILSPEQQATIRELPGVGDDPSAQLAAIDVMQKRHGWAQPLVSGSVQTKADAEAARQELVAAGVTTTPAGKTVPQTPEPTVAPATTAPPAGSAPASATPAAGDWKAQYAAMRDKNPYAAARIGAEHPEVYER
jgi:hypothetical protein